MGLISRASAAWELLWGGQRALTREAPPLARSPELVDLPIRRASVSRGTSFTFLPTQSLRKHARPGTWDLLEAYNEIPALRTCVDLLAPAAARIQYEFYRVRTPAERRHFERLMRCIDPEKKERLRRAMVDAGDLEPAPHHPAAQFVMRGAPAPVLGYPVLTGFEARELLYKYHLLSGESFVIIERRGAGGGRSKRGEPWGNIPVAPTDVTALPNKRDQFYVIRDADGLQVEVPAEDVLYRREVNPRDPYGRGTGASHSLSTELEIDRLQSEHMAESWASGTMPPVLIVGDFAAGNGPFGLSEDETGVKTQRMLMDWQRAVDRNHPHFMPGVDADGKPNVTVHDLSRTLQQMESQASRSATWGNIAQVIGRIPPELRGITGNSNRATAQAGWYLLQTGYLLSAAEKESAYIRERILPEWADEALEVDFISPVDRDFEAELRVMQSRPQAFMIDEYRKRAGEEELPDGKGQVFIWSPADVPVKDPSVDPFAGASSLIEAKGEKPAAANQDGGTPTPESEAGADGEAAPNEEEAAVGRSLLRGAPEGIVVHGLLPVPGQDQLDAEAALGSATGKGLSEAAHLIRVPEEAGAGVRALGNRSQSSAEGAVVKLGDLLPLGRGAESDGSVHDLSLVPTLAEVNRAASYITLDRIAAAMEPRLRDLLLSTLDRARSRVSEGLLVQAIGDGNVPRVVDLLGGAELARDMRRAEGLVAEVFKAAGIAASESLAGQLGQDLEFDARGRRVVSWAPQRSEDLATWVRQSIEDTGRLVVEHGQDLALSAAATAGAVMLTYGLASYLQDGRRAGPAFAVLAHQEALLEAGEAAEAAAAAAGAYRAELAAQRAGMFGGDQSYSAAQAGQGEAWRQAKDKGLLPESVRRYWVTRDDRRVCPVCDGLHGQKRGLDEPFTSPADGQSYANAGPYDGPHDGCRCALLLVGLRG